MKKLLLIIAGECFRDGGQFSRNKDTEKSIETQLLASDSHIRLIEYLQKTHNITTDIQLLSYESKYESLIIDKYKNHNLDYKFYNKYFSNRTELLNSYKIDNIQDKYDAILVIRPDICFKDYFLEAFDPQAQKILFPSICWIGEHTINNFPRVNDTMIFIPKYYFETIYYKIGIKLHHETVVEYVHNGIGLNNFDFVVKTLHDSDSAKDYNPMYYLVSRPQNKYWRSYGLEAREHDFWPIETDKIYNFEDWDIKNNIIYEQYHEIQNIDNLWEWWHDENGLTRFINVIEIDTTKTTEDTDYNIVRPRRCDVETYYQLKNDKLYFYNYQKNITSILFKRNSEEFAGKSLVSNAKLFLKKKINNLKINIAKPIKVAFCLRGGVSRRHNQSVEEAALYNINNNNPYIDFRAVAKSIKSHIIEPNKNTKLDIFIHSWSIDLSQELDNLYNPVISLYEDNNMYSDEIKSRCSHPNHFSGISQSLAIKRVLQLKELYEYKNKFTYDIVILYRPDVLLWKNIYLEQYEINNYIYVNGHPSIGNGDFHFIMSTPNAKNFKKLYDSPFIGNECSSHSWIKNYINNYMKQEIISDNIIAGRDQEIARPQKLRDHSIHQIDYKILERYGITKDYIFSE